MSARITSPSSIASATPCTSPARYLELTTRFKHLRIAVLGDFCLDRYWDLDPARRERSIETGRPVHNVVRVRTQPGGAGTIVNNLAALGVGAIYPLGVCGEDGEGWELERALAATPGTRMDFFVRTPLRRTFCYTKPMLLEPGRPPVELDRLDLKNWSPTPEPLARSLTRALAELAQRLDALIVLDQVDTPNTGVIVPKVLRALDRLQHARPSLVTFADSRQGPGRLPRLGLKMNLAELRRLDRRRRPRSVATAARTLAGLARRNRQPGVVTLAERGLLGATPDGSVTHVPAWPVLGPIDVVGAGDAVTANLATAMAAGAALAEALWIASAAASVVIHQLGTTGTANPSQISGRLGSHLHI